MSWHIYFMQITSSFILCGKISTQSRRPVLMYSDVYWSYRANSHVVPQRDDSKIPPVASAGGYKSGEFCCLVKQNKLTTSRKELFSHLFLHASPVPGVIVWITAAVNRLHTSSPVSKLSSNSLEKLCSVPIWCPTVFTRSLPLANRDT